MEKDQHENFFARLISPMLDQLRRLAYGTRGEQSVDDLKTEAWIAAQDVRSEIGEAIEPEDERLQTAVLSKLRKAFGKFANRKMRFAVQLDHEQSGDDGDFLPNSVGASLAAPDVYEPEIAIERAEELAAQERCLAERFTEAVAYLRTLNHFDHDRQTIARYLAIPASTLETRLRRAESVAESQPSMFDHVEAVPIDFVPQPGCFRPRSIRKSKVFRSMCPVIRPWQCNLFSVWATVFARR
ncbi:hypothetical protein F6X40_05290 [Paraburkholderia sp. UCT31]|uniref:hypothetical protein n=1 Tax=Paraburkholderia sp. UCT31 TaxID=2615209 RepID=UPI00165551B0|nr:hypothetical protein [Paraburkholderia sp. UCT31]MBC8736255.1 hypothetical protein [Paraburkholderia sp. UCT31]